MAFYRLHLHMYCSSLAASARLFLPRCMLRSKVRRTMASVCTQPCAKQLHEGGCVILRCMLGWHGMMAAQVPELATHSCVILPGLRLLPTQAPWRMRRRRHAHCAPSPLPRHLLPGPLPGTLTGSAATPVSSPKACCPAGSMPGLHACNREGAHAMRFKPESFPTEGQPGRTARRGAHQ